MINSTTMQSALFIRAQSDAGNHKVNTVS